MSEEVKKSEIIDETDDYEIFDEMEKSFYKVVQELVSDKSLDKFREEYEKLHEALVTSHEHNKVLIDKCRQLNNDILSNANKISSVLSVSQNDQRTIAGLRHEFEKSWKMVEVSQEREEKSKEVIETLKQEISNLSRLVEQGGTLAFTQESSLQEISDSIESLKKEIIVQTAQIEKTIKVKEEQQQATQMMITETAVLKEEEEQVISEIEEARKNNDELAKESDTLLETLKKAKQDIVNSSATIEDTAKNIKTQKKSNLYLQDEYEQNRIELNESIEDYKVNIQQCSEQKKILEDKSAINKKVMDSIIDKGTEIEDAKKKLEDSKQELEKVQVENTMYNDSYSEMKATKKEIENDRIEYRGKINSLRKQLYLLLTDVSRSDMEAKNYYTRVDRSAKEEKLLRGETLSERAATIAIENQQKSITGEIMQMKGAAYDARKNISTIEEETISYEKKAQQHKANIFHIVEEVKMRELQNDEEMKKLHVIENNKKRQEALTESVQNERDLACKQHEIAKRENMEINGEIEAVTHVIKQLKDDIREADRKCVETHFKRKRLESKLVLMAEENEEMKRKLKDVDLQITEARNRIQRSSYLLGQAEQDIYKQSHIAQNFDSTISRIDRMTTNKSREAEALQEKAHVVKSLIEKGANAFKIKTEEIQKLEEQLNQALDIQQKLLDKNRHGKALRLEIIRVEKTLVMEQGKCRALEEELEKPMNVHRWRILDGTNPELAQLLRMNGDLRDRLMMEMVHLDRLKKVCSRLHEKADVLEGHLQKSYGGNYEEEFHFLTEALRDKNRQLLAMESQLHEQQDVVEDHKEQVYTVRTMIREEKSGYYDTKKRVVEIRARTAQGSRPRTAAAPDGQLPQGMGPKTSRTKSRARFVGGGFAVGAVQAQAIQRPATARNVPTATGGLLTTTSPRKKDKTVVRQVPPGWNSKRAPISPYLPTLAH